MTLEVSGLLTALFLSSSKYLAKRNSCEAPAVVFNYAALPNLAGQLGQHQIDRFLADDDWTRVVSMELTSLFQSLGSSSGKCPQDQTL